MVSQILSSLMFAGSRIQVPNVCCTLTKWTGLPTDVMTHSSGEKKHVSTICDTERESNTYVTLCSRLPALLEGAGLVSSAFPARVSSFGTAQVSPRVQEEREKWRVLAYLTWQMGTSVTPQKQRNDNWDFASSGKKKMLRLVWSKNKIRKDLLSLLPRKWNVQADSQLRGVAN